MTTIRIERRRTLWDVVLGALLVVGGIVVLANAVLATAVSVIFLGWATLVAGIVLGLGSFLRERGGGFPFGIVAGVLLAVLGLLILRNVGATATLLTAVVAFAFLGSGLIRVALARQHGRVARWTLVVSGVISAGLGVFVLLELSAVSWVLLGTLLGIEIIIDGLTFIVVGRFTLVRDQAAPVPEEGLIEG